MKTTFDLPENLVKEIKLRAVHEGKKLKDAMADYLRMGLATERVGSPTVVKADKAMLKRRKAATRKFLSGEWGVSLIGFEDTQKSDRLNAEKRAKAWHD